MPNAEELIEHLFPLHSPKNSEVEAIMGHLRNNFVDLAYDIVANTEVNDDQSIAIRKLHDALMATIAAVANNQEGY